MHKNRLTKRLSHLLLFTLLAPALLYPRARSFAYYNLASFWKATMFPFWVNGTSATNSLGSYPASAGTGGTTYYPSSRYMGMSWVSGGIFYLFGGEGYNTSGTKGSLQDLWSFDPSTNIWTWLSGIKTGFGSSTYGTQYTPASGNKVGGRYGSGIAVDSSGNAWLFGGSGYDSANFALNNDLWKYTTGNLWGYWNGNSTVSSNGNCTAGSYKGQNGVAGGAAVFASTYQPGSRSDQAMWADSSNNLWMFGGYGCDTAGGYDALADTWKYDFTKGTNGQWAFMVGSTAQGSNGSFSSAPLFPSRRRSAARWQDHNGKFWLFGGDGVSSSGSGGYLNDLWKLDPTGPTWTWVSSARASAVNVAGVYGTKGVAASTNVPGSRDRSITWVDSSNRLYLYGGYGYDSAAVIGPLDDLWRYDQATGYWTWLSGHSSGGPIAPTYGTQGTSSATNVIGARTIGGAWATSTDQLWLFGGSNKDSSPTTYYADMWKVQ